MKAVIYIRVSTDEQAQEGFSIEAQKRKLFSYADSQDWSVTKIFIDDGYSAKDLNRPEMSKLLDYIKESDESIVLVYRLDRLTRSVKDLYYLLEIFEKNKIGFRSSQEQFDTTTTMGRAMLGILGIFAQWERETIAERVRLGMEQKVREGKKPGGKYPYGYNKKGELIQDEANIIRRVREMYMSENKSFRSIAVELCQEGITRRGYEWTRNTVALTLENPFYAGIIRYGTKMENGKYPQRKRDERVDCIEVVGDHEPIWTVEEYEEHIRLMRMRSIGNNSRNQEYIFSGLVRCGRCGAGMYGRLSTKRSKKSGELVRTPYYYCNKRKDNATCNMPMFRQVHIEHLIMEHIKKIELDKELLQFDNDQNELNQQLKKLKNEIRSIKERRKKWQYMFANELIAEGELRERLTEEKVKEDELNDKLISLSNQETKKPPEEIFQIKDLWEWLDSDDKRQIVLSIFDEIVLHTDETKVKGVRNKFFPAEVQVKYR